jgi:hypothetical protein
MSGSLIGKAKNLFTGGVMPPDKGMGMYDPASIAAGLGFDSIAEGLGFDSNAVFGTGIVERLQQEQATLNANLHNQLHNSSIGITSMQSGQAQVAHPVGKPSEWNSKIKRVENGFLVEFSAFGQITRVYIAKDIDEATEQIKVAMVAEALDR